uniref:Uncharacterized protein n=1 Tax=Tanacetum cinerariifolium TaxID=118510 RepID=A0A699JER0_TANCI|nr:hypothetical protein [Tanacetum cinerariifolium]
MLLVGCSQVGRLMVQDIGRMELLGYDRYRFPYHRHICPLSFKDLNMAALYILDKLSEAAGSSLLEDKIKLIDELEALGQRAVALKRLEYIREMVARDSTRVGVLEQLLAGGHVGMRLKANYATEMEETG